MPKTIHVAPSTIISSFVQSLSDTLLHNGVDPAILERSRSQLETLAEGFASEKRLYEQVKANQQLQLRVAELEKKVK